LVVPDEKIRTATSKRTIYCHIGMDDLRKQFHIPISEAAKRLNLCNSNLKKLCREFEIMKWPYRQVLGVYKTIQSMESFLKEESTENSRAKLEKQIHSLKLSLGMFVLNPNMQC
jgi:hypothetical protein